MSEVLQGPKAEMQHLITRFRVNYGVLGFRALGLRVLGFRGLGSRASF